MFKKKMNIKKSGIFLASVFLLSILSVSFVSAELCKWPDGYWRGCSGSSSVSKGKYSLRTSNFMGKDSSYSSMMMSGYGKFNYDKKMMKSYDHQYKYS